MESGAILSPCCGRKEEGGRKEEERGRKEGGRKEGGREKAEMINYLCGNVWICMCICVCVFSLLYVP